MVQQPVDAVEVGIDTNIHYVDIDSMELREHIDCCSVRKKVEHHLPGYLARIGADTFSGNSMVRGKDVDCLSHRLSKCLPTDRHHLRRKIFKCAEAAQRLGQLIQTRSCPH